MDAYADASCLVSLAIRDAHWEPIIRWFTDNEPAMTSSDFGLGEAVSAFGNRVRAGAIETGPATAAIAALRVRLQRWRFLPISADEISVATGFVADFTLGLRLPDAIHLAMARRLGATLLTTDRIQARAATVLGIACVDPTYPFEGTQP